MYYLLENNRIIKLDNAKFSECGLLKVYEETGKVTTLKLDGTIERYTGYFVKKQSENVYDLIDWNEDLVNINTFCGSLMVDCKHVKSDFNDGFYDLEWIKAIYKLDANGNYIKVWEGKDDN